ncbi:TetR/AcrR family transcriptional regulator [Cryobacterium sp. TMT1-3]|uniref:TetR/AcrR family transcriptional regulator n=1 Tax=Cryobacterium luteum TaxID=1424661 RepID=A0A1H8EEN0_9MICO|nr:MULTISPECIES: TetR/AcrR family transcriptional regulator [Cryobacterium]TFB89895.1 TetR/AcrR family transcriptional regulator [Cryobacterium luteum]TFC25607.1 TetR/AcrR family transcriptional regulator [Cryobacterium sp. TMT1-3]SEN17830.1 transcriptional regulator, TetR family [Cryobacterium luteum]
MGRLQTFDSGVVVQAARDLFWDKGYDGVSLAELESATGVGRSSLYHAFGSKRGLFDAAVSDYLQSVIGPRLVGLRAGATDASALLDYFDSLAQSTAALADDSPRSGCLLVNCAAGLGAHDDSARTVVEGYRAELSEALRQALAAVSSHADAAPVRIDERVRTLASLSMSAMLVARVNRDEAIALLNTASNQVRAWFPDAMG